MTTEEKQHLAKVLAHDGLVPLAGMGGCSCELCSGIREEVRSVWSKEAQEFLEAHEDTY